MGLTGNFTFELEIKSPADKYFDGWKDIGALFSKAIPDGTHKSEVHEGDGKSVGSINSYCFVLDGTTVATGKGKVESIDEENKTVTFSGFGGHLEERYSKCKLNVEVFKKDGKNLVKGTIEYEKLNEEIPEPINYLDVAIKFAKGLDAHLLQA
ncbi:hypothetical protein NE237_027465 [Protea cynaroides]|uniref:Bet v I/Major latex protein domain-containing protein n=1 Tax=Protea cynaroides TaxID=273540 RepID=A0A9Q0GQ71_9MAGN|nr:hypothetical protein NE237_027465 [Protea cynaroides]